MFLRRSDSNWEVRAPAKVNLFLEVLARCDDGFHEIETLMVPIDLFDTLYFSSLPGGSIELKSEWAVGCRRLATDWGDVPDGADNLIVRALSLLRKRSGTWAGARMYLVKRIPLAAGLGGGSSDAAAALAVANRAWQLYWPYPRLRDLAAALGSDVPFFLGSGGAICRGRGERIRRVSGLGPLHLVVVRPPAGLPTGRVYASCRPATDPRRSAPLLMALRRGELARAGRLMHNRLQAAAESLSPWIGRLKEEFKRLGCLGHQMTGSGTGYFGLCRTARHARRVAGVLRSRSVGSVFQAGICQSIALQENRCGDYRGSHQTHG